MCTRRKRGATIDFRIAYLNELASEPMRPWPLELQCISVA